MNHSTQDVHSHQLWLYLVTAAAVTLALVVGRLRLANELVAVGLRIGKLEERRAAAIESRSIWLARYAAATSAERLAERARDLGFKAPSEMVYLPVPLAVADGAGPALTSSDSALALTLPARSTPDQTLAAQSTVPEASTVLASAFGNPSSAATLP